jgi:hypothetical protein
VQDTPLTYQLDIATADDVFTTPNLRTSAQTYDFSLNSTNTTYSVTVLNVVYTLTYISDSIASLTLSPLDVAEPILIDVKRSTQYDSTVEGQQWDNYTLSETLNIDQTIYSNSNEIHRTRLRQQDPTTGLWSLCDIKLFMSNGGARTTLWIEWIEMNASYGA